MVYKKIGLGEPSGPELDIYKVIDSKMSEQDDAYADHSSVLSSKINVLSNIVMAIVENLDSGAKNKLAKT